MLYQIKRGKCLAG